MHPRYTLLDASGQPLAVDADPSTAVAVLDTTTQLIWSRAEVGDDEIPHADAEQACGALALCGWQDWRLPTDHELLSLVDRSRYSPAIDTDAFPACKNDWYWTSTPAAWSPSSRAWFVDFYDGYAGGLHRDDNAFVRAVRSVVAVPPGQ